MQFSSPRNFMFAVLVVLCAAARDSRAATVALTATGNNGGQTVHTTVTVNFDTSLFHGTKKKNSSTTVSLGGIIFAAPKTDPVSSIDPTGDPLAPNPHDQGTPNPNPNPNPGNPVVIPTSPYQDNSPPTNAPPQKPWNDLPNTPNPNGPAQPGGLGSFSPAAAPITPLPPAAQSILSLLVLLPLFTFIRRTIKTRTA